MSWASAGEGEAMRDDRCTLCGARDRQVPEACLLRTRAGVDCRKVIGESLDATWSMPYVLACFVGGAMTVTPEQLAAERSRRARARVARVSSESLRAQEHSRAYPHPCHCGATVKDALERSQHSWCGWDEEEVRHELERFGYGGRGLTDRHRPEEYRREAQELVDAGKGNAREWSSDEILELVSLGRAELVGGEDLVERRSLADRFAAAARGGVDDVSSVPWRDEDVDRVADWIRRNS